MVFDIASRFGDIRNFVFIGEAGSGKTEIAINFARLLQEKGTRPVHFFDMDQTKPLFRARDAAKYVTDAGIQLIYQPQLLDTPLVPPGVIEAILDENCYTILDVGGNEQGARMMGQFSGALNASASVTFFVVNAYRPWSRDLEGIESTVARISRATRFTNIHIVSNPNLGFDTRLEEVLAGHEKLLHMLSEQRPEFICALERLSQPVGEALDIPVLPVRLHILYPWQE